MAGGRSRTKKARARYARMLAGQSGCADPRIEAAFTAVPREDFLPPGPWRLIAEGTISVTPDADPVHLYDNVLVALDRSKGINTGEPLLHAIWICAVAPRPGETVVQVGAGAGYYTAILATLVAPGGRVVAYEVEPGLAAAARKNLGAYANAAVVAGSAVAAELPPSDIIYVNAGVIVPPLAWLDALKPGGRMIFPWRPNETTGLAVMATRNEAGFSATVLGGAWFIACEGADDPAETMRPPTRGEAKHVRAIVPNRQAEPDASAVAVYRDLWFSSSPPEAIAVDRRAARGQ